jgi:conjugal transfer/entry exclusion protein
MRTLALSLALSLCLLSGRANAAMSVTEVGANLVANQISAVQNVLMVANQVLDLTAVGTFVLDTSAWAAELRHLQEVVATGSALAWDLVSIEAQVTALFGLEGAPTTATGFEQRAAEIRRA